MTTNLSNNMTTNLSNQQFWQPYIDAWQESGLSGPAFCQQHDLVYHRFSYWRRKLVSVQTNESVFSQVTYSVDKPLASGLSLVLPNGIEVRGIDQSNLSVLHGLLRGANYSLTIRPVLRQK